MPKGWNMMSVKSENRSLILYLLNSCGPLSRKEIAERLGLTPAAVTKICSKLISEGFITESGASQERGKSGRREIYLSLCLREKLVLGINAEKDVITFSLCRLDGSLCASDDIPFTDSAEAVIEKAKGFLSQNGIAPEQLTGVGVCIIGSLKEDDFGVWKEENLQQRFENSFDVPVIIENNVKAFAQAELIYGNIDHDGSVLLLKWGPGVGSAIVADGKVYSGSDSSVAEIGHYIVNTGGAKCRCGRFGCLETEVSKETIERELNHQQTLDETLQNCDNESRSIIEHKIDLVALVLTNTATILNASDIVLFGSMFSGNRFVAEGLKKQCLRYNSNLGGDIIKLSALNDKSAYIGAAAVCARHLFFERAVQ